MMSYIDSNLKVARMRGLGTIDEHKEIKARTQKNMRMKN